MRKEERMKDYLIIFDTTLRDGEQSPGASMTQGREGSYCTTIRTYAS